MEPIAQFLAVVIDCHDPRSLADFWIRVLGGTIEPVTLSDDWVGLKNVPGMGYMGLQRVPEAKAVKNRVHIDVRVDDVASAIAAVVAAGGRSVGDIVDESTNLMQVMLDPEDNEFCLIQLTPRRPVEDVGSTAVSRDQR